MSEREELKPCPFCGTSPTEEGSSSMFTSATWIQCRKCGVLGDVHFEEGGHGRVGFEQDGNDCGLSRSPHVLWNRRPIEEALSAECAQLRADLAAAEEAIREIQLDGDGQLDLKTVYTFRDWLALPAVQKARSG